MSKAKVKDSVIAIRKESKNERDDGTCSICLDSPIKNPEKVKPCRHVFCNDCLKELRRRSGQCTKCPLCRTILDLDYPLASLDKSTSTSIDIDSDSDSEEGTDNTSNNNNNNEEEDTETDSDSKCWKILKRVVKGLTALCDFVAIILLFPLTILAILAVMIYEAYKADNLRKKLLLFGVSILVVIPAFAGSTYVFCEYAFPALRVPYFCVFGYMTLTSCLQQNRYPDAWK